VGTRGKELVPTQLTEVVNGVLDGLGPTIDECQAEVTVEPLPVVVGDEAQLEQLFQNLIGNALKFKGAGPPRVHVSVEAMDQKWVFSVRDNGIGIDPQYFQRIFVIFQRLHGKDEYPGTGIGLAICKKIVERHGGRIWVESVPGEGATFYFTLPMAETDESAHQRSA
jgi:light-regulated signal transduction histidine kinase (bacteriophytochrome)